MSRPGKGPGDSPESGDFLGRWSARKLGARAGAQAETGPEPPAEPSPAAGPADPPADPYGGKTEAEVLEELGLPDPDTLMKGDDFRAFLRAGIPARLRTRALRRLWVSDPVLANLDGLNDYDQDFTDAATVVKELKTAYHVTRGMLREPLDEATRDTPPQPMPADPDALGAAVEGPAQADAAEPAIGEPTDAELAVRDDPDPAEAPENPAASPPRMRFRFETG